MALREGAVKRDVDIRRHEAIEEQIAAGFILVVHRVCRRLALDRLAQRLSTIRAVDRIVVFHNSRIFEVGSHDELLQKNGVYARLHKLQFARERAA